MPFPKTSLKLALILMVTLENLETLQRTSKGNARVTYINTPEFVGSITGYAYVTYDPEKKSL